MFKNVAASFMVFAFDSTTNLPKTGDAANITAYVSKDYGAVTVLADTSATEMDATNAKGYYLFAAAQGETNGDILMVSAKSATSNIVVIGAPAIIYTRPTTGWLAPTTAGRTLDVSVGGEAGVDWANVGSPTTSLALTGTTIAVTQKVDVDTIKTNPVVNGGTITFPTTATLASTTNITAGTITTATNLTNAPTSGDFTATMKTSIGTAVAASAVASVTGNVGGNVTGSVGSVTGLTASNLDATISSRLASASYTAPLTAATTRSALGLASASLDTQIDGLPTATENADALLNRDMSAVSDTTARSPLNALRAIRNKISIAAGTVTVTKEDDTTSAWTAAVTTDATADPITIIDPA